MFNHLLKYAQRFKPGIINGNKKHGIAFLRKLSGNTAWYSSVKEKLNLFVGFQQHT